MTGRRNPWGSLLRLGAIVCTLGMAGPVPAAIFEADFEDGTVGSAVPVDTTPSNEPAVNISPNSSVNYNGSNVGNQILNTYTDTGGTGYVFGSGKVAVLHDSNTSSSTAIHFEHNGNPTSAGKMVVAWDMMHKSTGQVGNCWTIFTNSSGQTLFQIMWGSGGALSLFEYPTTPGSGYTQHMVGSYSNGALLQMRVEIDLTANTALVKINGAAVGSTYAIAPSTDFSGTRFTSHSTGTRTMAIDNFDQQVEQTGLTIVAGGSSSYQIYYAAGSPQSVVDAANDLKAVILAATGANLTITTSLPAGNMICLGSNTAATNAGATLTGVEPEGFRIKTVNQNLYILGVDTPSNPAGQSTADGGFCRGTYNGVSYLWETILNARYLLPGPNGLDVPSTPSVVVPAQDTVKAPFFPGREFDYAGQTPNNLNPASPNDIDRWLQRNRMGKSISYDRAHSWQDHPSQATLNANPLYMAQLTAGIPTRQSTGIDPDERKYCTTNTGLQTAFASSLNARFIADAAWRKSISLSPTDSIGGCHCTSPNCAAHVLTSTVNGSYAGFKITRSKQIVKWYNDVATIFYNTYGAHANKKLAGYLYNEYALPPAPGTFPALHANVQLYYAPRHYYGMMLFKTGALTQYQSDVAAWAGAYPGQMHYSDYPMWAHNIVGAPLPAGVSVLDGIMSAHQSAQTKHMIFNCNSAWGWAGLKHYILARKMWDPTLSTTAVRDEFLNRAYGPGGSSVGQIYTLLDSAWTTYLTTRPLDPAKGDWMTDQYNYMIAGTIAANFNTIEGHYFTARTAITNQPGTTAQETAQLERLKMFGKNMAVLHWRLRHMGNAGMNTNAYTDGNGTGFYMDDPTFTTWRAANSTNLALQKDWNHATTGVGTFKDHPWYVVDYDYLALSPGQKVTVPINNTHASGYQDRVNGQSGFNGTGGVQIWDDYKDSVTPALVFPTSNQLVFSAAAGGTVPSVEMTVGQNDSVALGVWKTKFKMQVDKIAGATNSIYFTWSNSEQDVIAVMRVNLNSTTSGAFTGCGIQALAYSAPDVLSGAYTDITTYTKGTPIDIEARFHFDPSNPRVEYYINGAGSPSLTKPIPKWTDIRRIHISGNSSTRGIMATDNWYLGR